MKTTTNIRYVNLTDSTTLAGYIAETCVRANKLKDRIQIASVGILMHVGTHNNKPQAVKFANSLIEGLGQGIQCKALIEWFVEFGTLIADDGKGFADVNLEKVKAEFQRAKTTHWVSFAPVSAWAGFKFDDKLAALFKAASDAQDRANKSEDDAKVVDINANKLAVLKVVSGLDSLQLQQLMSTLNVGAVTETGETTDFTTGLADEDEAETVAA